MTPVVSAELDTRPPCASGRCRNGAPCRRLAALVERLAPVKEDLSDG